VDGGDVLVDGAVLNNFPVDVMQELHRGPTIGIDVARQQGINAAEFADPPGFFGWVARNGLHAAPPIAGLLMRAATVTIDPWSQRDRADMLITPALEDMELRDWKRFDHAVEAGYRETVAALQTLRGPLKSLAQRGGG
jgi:NTE family protein